MDKFRQYKNYGIITVVSLFCLFFLPFTGSTLDLGFTLPNTVAGWIVFTVNKLIIAAVNILILYCFYNQGKYNVRNDPKYLEASEILLKNLDSPELRPRSPKQHAFVVFGKKGVTLFITTILGTISLTQAVLTFEWITMLTYFFVITSGIIFGVIQMGEEEWWWTNEYWRYAKMIEKEYQENNENHNEKTTENSLE